MMHEHDRGDEGAPRHARIEIDGNDGVGKSTLVRTLASLGITAQDRGRLTKASDDSTVPREEGVLYLVIDATVPESRARLAAAGKDLNERYHTVEDLTHYRQRFIEEAARFEAPIIHAKHPAQTLLDALAIIEGAPLRVALPKGRLAPSWQRALRDSGLWPNPPDDVDASGRYYRLDGLCDGITAPWLLRARTIPSLVQQGMVDVGVTGRDLVEECCGDTDALTILATLPASPVRVVAAAPEGASPLDAPSSSTKNLVVATPYPNLAARWMHSQGLAHTILHTHGSTEVFTPDFADLIIDVTDTGETLQAHNLRILADVLHTEPVLVARRDRADRAAVRAFAGIMQGASILRSA